MDNIQIIIDSVPGETPPPDTFVSMRVGDVQKQTRFEKSRTYRFPDPNDERGSFGRLEVFKRIGTLTVPLDVCRNAAEEIEVPCCYPDFDRLKVKMSVSGGGGASKDKVAGQDDVKKKTRAKQRMDEAQQYLANFNLEDCLADAMREVIREKPDNPYTFLSNHILQQGGFDMASMFSDPMTTSPSGAPDLTMMPRSAKAGAKAAAAQTGDPSAEQAALSDVLPFSSYYGTNFQVGSVDGLGLDHTYRKFHDRPTKILPPPYPFQKLPSVGTWLAMPSAMEEDSASPQGGAAAAAAGEAREMVQMDPFQIRPSVGTWLMKEAPAVERPWYYKDGEWGQHTGYVKALTKVIKTRDDEMDALKAQIAQLQAMAAGGYPSSPSSLVGSPAAARLPVAPLQAKAPVEAQPAKAIAASFHRLPTVGTWLQHRFDVQ